MPKVKLRDGTSKQIGEADRRTGKYSEEDKLLAEVYAEDFGGEVILDSDKSGQVEYWAPRKNAKGMGRASRGGKFRD
jgi:hypothetical protein